MMTMTILSMVMAAAYVAAATLHWRRAPESLSAMVYVLPPVGRWLWTVWLWAVALTACIPLMGVLPETAVVLGFATLVCLLLVGAMPLWMTEHRRWHYRLAVAAGVLSQIAVAVVDAWCLLGWLVYVPLMLIMAWPDVRWCEKVAKAVEHKGVLIAEAVCALTVYGAVIAQSIAAS